MLWNWKYKLYIGKAQKTNFTKDNHVFNAAEDLQQYYQDAEKNGFLITDHQMTFKIEKKAGKDKGQSSVTLVNLDDDMVNYLTQNSSSDLVLMLEAGFGDNLKQLFRGTVKSVLDDFDTETRSTEIKLGDGVVNTQGCISSRTFNRGTQVDSVVSQLISDLGLPKGTVEKVGKQLSISKAYHGQTSTLLNRIATDNGMRFSIQDGRAFMVRVGVRPKTEVAKLTPDSGLLGSPKPSNVKSGGTKKSGKTIDKKENNNTFDVSCLLDGAVTPESAIYIDDGQDKVVGWFKVLEVTYTGDYRGSSWMNTMKVSKVEVTI